MATTKAKAKTKPGEVPRNKAVPIPEKKPVKDKE